MDFNDYFIYQENDHSCLITKQGRNVGYISTCGYWKTMFQRKSYRVHRIIWEMLNGKIPDGFVINHIDNVNENNKISNLEICTISENNRRAIMHTYGRVKTNNSSGTNGVVIQYASGRAYASGRWYDKSGKKFSKSFSIDRFGKELAVSLAKSFREDRIREIYGNSLDYSSLESRNEVGITYFLTTERS